MSFHKILITKILDRSFSSLTNYLQSSENYFKNRNYFQAKYGNFSIQIVSGLGNNAIIVFKKEADFKKLALDIMNNAYFDFKFCNDYDSSVVYNFHSGLENRFRFNFDELRISVEYPNSLSEFAQSNIDLLGVFVCGTDDSYAYHTNLRCGNLNQCSGKIYKSTIREATGMKYRICGSCTSIRE